jgi:hypothetical protein
MKTKAFIITALLACTVSLLFAGSPKTIIIKSESMTIEIHLFDDISWLAPETPKEATFEDSEPRPAPDIARLAPITPKEATFEDLAADPTFPAQKLDPLVNIRPETPEVADFEDTPGSGDSNIPGSWDPLSFAFSALK